MIKPRPRKEERATQGHTMSGWARNTQCLCFDSMSTIFSEPLFSIVLSAKWGHHSHSAYFIGLLLETNESEDVKVLSDVSSITNGTTCLVNAVVIPGRHPDVISLPLKYGTNSWHDDQNHEALPKGGFPACGPVRNPFLPASLNGLLIRSLLFVLRRGRWKIRTCFPLNLSY